MKLSELKNLIRECVKEVVEKPDYATQLNMAWKKAKKEKNIHAIAYYELLGDTSASVPFEKFKGSWAYEEWLKKPTTIQKIKEIEAEYKRFPWRINEDPLKTENFLSDSYTWHDYVDKKTGKKIKVRYYPEVDTEYDRKAKGGIGNRKIYHVFVDEQGIEVTGADFDPYSKMTSEDIKNWFSLGSPNRNDFKMQSPLNSDVLKKAIVAKSQV